MAKSVLIHAFSSDTTKHKNNKSSSFIISLDESIYLPKGSKLALLEISYFNDLIIDDSKAQLTVYNWLEPRPGDKWGKKHIFHLGKETFVSPDSLTGLLNSFIFEACPQLTKNRLKIFEYDKKLNRIWILFSPLYFFTLKISGKLLDLLGYATKPEDLNHYLILGKSKPKLKYQYNSQDRDFASDFQEKLDSKYPKTDFFEFSPMLHEEIYTIICYCDAVINSKINTTQGPILRIFPFKISDKKEMITLNFSANPQYIDVRNTNFQNFSIELRSIHGDLIPLSKYVRVTFQLLLPP